MRQLVFHADDVANGFRCEMRFEAATPPIDEGRTQAGPHGQLVVDQTRFMQAGVWHGWFEVDGRRIEFDRASCNGVRDKSWGVRPMAEQSASVGGGGSLFWMNVVRVADGQLTIARTTNGPDGRARDRAGYSTPMMGSPAAVKVERPTLRKLSNWDFELDLVGGTRRIGGARYRFEWRDGDVTELSAEPISTLWYSGMGYEHRRWQHGLDHGGLEVERESWRLDDIDLSEPEGTFMCHTLAFTEDGRPAGFGHTEQMFLGRYDPYGWVSQR
jgi:hypothetical protein